MPEAAAGRVRPLYTGLRVRELSRSIRFYKVLSFRQTIRLRTSIGVFAQLEHPNGRFTIELNQFKRGSRAYEPYRDGSQMDHFGLWVDSVDRWVEKLRRVGGKLRIAPFDTSVVISPRPWFRGRAAYVADPDGIWIELMGPVRGKGTPPRSLRGRRRRGRPSP